MATVLELDLTAPLLDAPPTDPVNAVLARRRTVLRDLVDGLRAAASDTEVVGLIAHVGSGPRLTHIEEIHAAVRQFAASGKQTIAWTESFGELGGGTLPYYLATAFDEIWMQPSGTVGVTGFWSEALFVRDALDKLGLAPQFGRRREYKNAVDGLVEQHMTEAHREAASRLVSSAMEQLRTAIIERRGLTAQQITRLIDDAPLPAERALTEGLIDRLGYRDEAYAALRRDDRSVRLRYLQRYVQQRHRAKAMEPVELLGRLSPRLSARPAIALVHALGSIHLGRSSRRPTGGQSIGSDTLGAVLRAAAEASDVRAVVLRVDSGGGSYIASDAIRREVLRVREAGKPLVVSMGAYAASGGYFIAMAADAIVALPGTLTGSIGVLGGKVVVRDLLTRAGINTEGVGEGQQAAMFSPHQSFTEQEWHRMENWLDQVYADFTSKVATDRSLPPEAVETLARGRVWTGADAHTHGLIDELGGLDRALDLACARARLERADTDVRPMPRLGVRERLRPAESSEDLPAAANLRGRTPAPSELVADLLGVPGLGVLSAPVLHELR